jgi:uncharacterized repeat protein (TIGR01451 family)/uncharacterized repeat protein (TIGR02543 family)
MIYCRKKGISILFLFIFVTVFSPWLTGQETEEKYTVYVIADMNGNPNFPLQAHLINNEQIIPAEEWPTPRRDGGPVGLAVDDDNSRLYVSYEFSGIIDVFNARTLVPIDDPLNPGTPLQITLPGAGNVAGMVVSELRGRLYAIDRNNPHLYVYDSSNYTRIMAEEFDLTGTTPFGIDVWGNVIFVTSGYTQTIRYFSMDSHTEIGNFTISDVGAMAIAVDASDPNNVMVFTTMTFQNQVNGLLTKYNINTDAESSVALNADGRGVSVHPTLGLVYVATGYSPTWEATLRVYDQATLTLQDSETLGSAYWTPSDVVASRIQFGGSVSKTCTSHPQGEAQVGDTVTFDIAITNNSTAAIDVLPLTDTYDTTYLQFLSSSVASDDSLDDGQIDWSDLTDLLGNVDVDATVTVTVNFMALAATTTSTNNVGLMHDALDTFGSPIPDAAGLAAMDIVEAPIVDEDVQLRIITETGGTTNPTPGSYIHNIDDTVTITAYPLEGYTFCGWSGHIQPGTENDNPLVIHMTQDKTITAHFCQAFYCVRNARGVKVLNRSLSQAEYINNLSWEANPANTNIIAYRIYQVENETRTLLVEVNSDTFMYSHRNVEETKLYIYEIVPVNSNGMEGCVTVVEVE